MTGPDNTPATRPISVAELLAKNGTIGSPPVGGGRRRRRRGNNDAVTVAELTGEIPILGMDDSGELPVVELVEQSDEPESDDDGAVRYDAVPEAGSNGNGSSATVVYDTEPGYESSRPVTRLEKAPEPLPRRGRDAPPERSEYPRPRRLDERPQRETAVGQATGAESMSPDPIDDEMVIVYQSADVTSAHIEVAGPDELGIGDVSYVRDEEVSAGLLFSGDSMADEMARGTVRSHEDLAPIAGDLSDDLLGEQSDSAEALDDADLSEAFDDHDADDYGDYDDFEEPSRGRLIVHGLVIALQSILAVAFGAGLFLAFDQLWQWNSLVAMVLAILATLGLVAGVWVVRKTEDIASTLIAVGVGLLVTFGPLALMHAS